MAGKRSQTAAASDDAHNEIRYVSISDETRRRYLNYAMSVIMSRALPDVRDGLKPVQRRILYTMYEDLRLLSDAKYRKSSKIVGDTTGNYHPHGGSAVYEAMVRLAQPFTLRAPLVDGQGNFGHIMGLPAAADRYTEARVTKICERLMAELRYQTVDMRLNYDGMREEPVVLPAQFPNLLVNGTQGIAVGMATNIPPHHPAEVLKACSLLIDNPEITLKELMRRSIKGPDFPMGGRIVTNKDELADIYADGRGSIKMRAEWKLDREGQKEISDRIIINSIPYTVETGPLLNSIGDIRDSKKLPYLVDVSDESSDELGMRIVLSIKPGSDPNTVMAYLFKHTRLEENFAYNSTCLVPEAPGSSVLVPRRCGLTEILNHFLLFRFETVRKRFQFLLEQLERRIHILKGFVIVFDGLEKALKIIRQSSGKQDACEKLVKAFPLDEIQAMAILELQLYRISTLEIGRIREELAEKEKEASRIRKILAADAKLWGEVKKEIDALAEEFNDKRRTNLGNSDEIVEFDPQAYIVRENTNIVLTSEAWVRRLGKISSIDKLRTREGETISAVLPASTVDFLAFFANDGVAYTLPVEQIPPSTGYGEPLSKHIKLSDGSTIVHAVSTDSRFTPGDEEVEGLPSSPYLLVVTASGQVMRIPFSPFRQASTKAGRKYCRLVPGDKVVHVEFVKDEDTIFLISRKARLIHFPVLEVPVLSGAGKGVRGIKLPEGDVVLGAKRMTRPSDVLKVMNENEKQISLGQMKYAVTGRGGKGYRVSQRTDIVSIVQDEIAPIDWSKQDASEV